MDGPFSAHSMMPVVASLSSSLSLSHSPLLPPPHLTTPWKGARGQEPGISRTIYLYNNSEGKKKTLLIDLADLLKCILYWTGFGSPRLTVVHMDLTNCKPVNDCVSKRRPLTNFAQVSGDPRILISCTKSGSAFPSPSSAQASLGRQSVPCRSVSGLTHT